MIREPLCENDINDVATAMEKVVRHASQISAEIADDDCGKVFTPVDAAVDTDVS